MNSQSLTNNSSLQANYILCHMLVWFYQIVNLYIKKTQEIKKTKIPPKLPGMSVILQDSENLLISKGINAAGNQIVEGLSQ